MLEQAEGEHEPRLRRSGLAFEEHLRRLEHELEVVETDLARTRPLLGRGMLAVSSSSDLLRRLPAGHIFVEYLLGSRDLLVFVAAAGQVEVHVKHGVAAELDELVASVRFHLDTHPWADPSSAAARRRGLEARLERLGQLLLGAIPTEGWDTLWLAPHDGLYHLPWATLVDGSGRSLIDRGVLTLVPGSGLVSGLLEHDRRSPDRITLAGSCDAGLPMVEDELDTLSDLMPSARRLTTVSRDGLLEALSTSEIVHLAGHALFLDGVPGASGLRLDDGFLTIHDLAAAPMRALLVSFGVCSGMRLAERDPYRYEGFLRVLLSAGVRTVIGPVAWVRDEVACAFDECFYRQLQRLGDTGEAFRAALSEVRRLDPHPAAWGVFHHYGDPRSWRAA
jgi:CHAT domain-containing protein